MTSKLYAQINTSESGNLNEIFSGIQGEGLLVGDRQIFIRLSGCNLRCPYCDTSQAWEISKSFQTEMTPGVRDFASKENPAKVSEVVECVSRLNKPGLHEYAVITGGEPLFQPDFAANLAVELKELGLKVFLETNGTLPDDLDPLISYLDFVSMDIKLPSSSKGDYFELHQAFLQKVSSKEMQVKIVMTYQTTTSELEKATEIIRSVDENIPLILQPVTGNSPPSASQVLEWQSACKLRLRQVRVIPQCHKIMGQM